MPDPSDKHLTPAMRQFHRFKKQHPGCVLFFRMGDFYEMFYDDAKLAHRVLGVTLTQRTEGVPMAGVPYHSVTSYLQRMIRAGHRVAVCEQMEDPAQAKGVVRRDVTRVITPGTLTDETLLDEACENVLAAVVFHGPGKAGTGAREAGETGGTGGSGGSGGTGGVEDSVSIAWAELSTGSFQVATLAASEAADELARIAPRELLHCETATGQTPPRVARLTGPLDCAATGRPAWQFRQGEALEVLRRQYQVAQLAGFGFEEDDPALAAAGAVVHYLLETQCAGDSSTEDHAAAPEDQTRRDQAASPIADHTAALSHLQPPRRFVRTRHLIIDQTSLRSLEVQRTIRGGEVKGSLLDMLLTGRPGSGRGGGAAPAGGCVTAMGKRLLRQWLCYPLCERSEIEQRQRVVEALVNDRRFLDEMREAMDQVHDVPRIIARLAVGRASPRDLSALGASAGRARALERVLAKRPPMKVYHDRLTALCEPLEALAARLAEACVDAPPAHLREGGLIREGFDAVLDEQRALQRDSHDWLAQYQKKLIEQTGIASLKVGYNKVYGYYIEVTAANRDKAAPLAGKEGDWTRKQTLKNAERYITPELKDFEQKVLTAESRALAREQALFAKLCVQAQQHIEPLRRFAQTAAELDVLGCFGGQACGRGYVKPTLVDPPVLRIEAGRHPVLGKLLGDRFVPNDLELGAGASQSGNGEAGGDGQASDRDRGAAEPAGPTLALITGPNMAGKSTYIRQTALITLLAHTGAFVPAEAATIGVCDRIFTRIGASDELHAGQSTFMVEMTEAANICHHATPRSLVILDEIGRGTSTLDGLSLAWAIAEHLATPGSAAGASPQNASSPNASPRTASSQSGRPAPGPRTLFATHYHELTRLADAPHLGGAIVNLNVTVREWRDQIVFLHRIAPGRADRSYGIHVAKLAGLPRPVIDRADDLLRELAVSHNTTAAPPTVGAKVKTTPAPSSPPSQPQLPLFTEYVPHPVIEKLQQADLTDLSPLEAFDLLRDLRREVDRT